MGTCCRLGPSETIAIVTENKADAAAGSVGESFLNRESAVTGDQAGGV